MRSINHLKRLTIGVSALALGMGLALPANGLVVRDDVGVGGSEDGASGTEWDGVVQLYRWDPSGSILFNCTGTLINPRTVISASHCFTALPSTAYGTNRAGGDTTIIVAYGPDTFDGLFNWINTGSVTLDARNGVAFSSQVIIHPDADDAFGAGLPFPAGDVSLVALNNPLANLPTYSMLFSPVPVGTHVTQVAYGGHGVGSTGNVGIDGKRQIGENIIGLIGSQNDFLRGTFGRSDAGIFGNPDGDQSLYFIDFDNPGRVGDECARQPNGDLICSDAVSGFNLFGTVLAPSGSIDYFGGDALPGEAGTAGGDSGSAIFVDELGTTPLIAGVLSGGFNFVTPVSNGYGDVSYYNPLFNFHQFISEANPYKYVSAVEGDGNWSDAGHWTQQLDPGYFILDANGNLVNGLPTGPEPGVAGTGPREGTIYDVDINSVAPAAGAEAGNLGNITAVATTGTGLVAVADGAVPELGTFGVGDVDFGLASVVGATDFTPNNGRNAAGYLNYFDVTLNAVGTTTADVDVVIDRLTLDNAGAGLVIADGVQFVSLVDTQIAAGMLDVQGVFASRDILNGGMVIGSGGTIVTDTFFNAGVLNAGANGLTIEGDLVLTSMSTLLYSGTALGVDGDVSVDGGVAVMGGGFGTSGTLLTHTGARVGTFNGDLAGVLQADFTYNANSVDFAIGAADFETEFNGSGNSNTRSIGRLLDGLRGTDYADKAALYSRLDVLSGTELTSSLDSLAPDGALAQQGIGLASAETRMGQLGARVDAIRAGRADGASFQADATGGGSRLDRDMGGLTSGADLAASVARAGQSGWGSFVSVSYYEGDQTRLVGTGDRDIDGVSVTFGIDRDISPNTRLGVFGSYTDTDSDAAGSADTVTSDGLVIGGYGVKTTSEGDFSAYVGFGQRDMKTARAGIDAVLAQGSTEADEVIAGIAASKMHTFGENGFGFEPEARLDYVRYDIGGYTETGSVSAVTVAAWDVSSTQLSVGGDVHFYDTRNEATRWRSSAGARFVYDASGDDTTAVISLPGQIGPGTATLTGAERDQDWFTLNAGLEYAGSERATGGVFLETTAGRDDLDYMTVGAKLKVKF